MKLYGSPTSPYVRKLRVLIKEKPGTAEFIEVASAADPQITARNPLGKVPVLERDDGSMLFDSPVIAQYLDAQKAPALIPDAGEPRWQVLRWEALSDGMVDATVVRLLETRRPAAQQSPDILKQQEGKIARAMEFAQSQLGSGTWLVGGRFCYADIALMAAIDYVDLRFPHDWRARYPALAQWHAALAPRPAFAETRPPAPK
jgi:glutathione S-transferase